MPAVRRFVARLLAFDTKLASAIGPHDASGSNWTLRLVQRLWLATAVVLVLLIAAVAALVCDVAISKFFLQNPDTLLRRMVAIAEPFGNGWGVLLVVILIWQLDPARRRDLLFVVTASYGAGLVANLAKMTVVRVRPHSFDFVGGVATTFGYQLDSTAGGSSLQSFPSAHTATAVGLAIALSLVYPRSRNLFFIIAIGVAMQRVCAGAHFLSDVLAGAALGLTVGVACARAHLRKWRQLGAFPRVDHRANGNPAVEHLERKPIRAESVDHESTSLRDDARATSAA